jgi:hypothetical protein
LASAAALVALWLRADIDDPVRAVAGTLRFAVIYLGIGATVGALVRSPVNDTVLILFVWILDVFFGRRCAPPETSYAPARCRRTSSPCGWRTCRCATVAASATSVSPSRGRSVRWHWRSPWWRATVRISRRHRLRARPGSVRDQLAAASRMGWRDWRRNPVFNLFGLHAGTMAPIAVASLATLAGLFVVLDTGPGDRRLALVGLRPGVTLVARLAVIGLATALATAVSLAVAATVFAPRQWGWYAVANALIAITYAPADDPVATSLLSQVIEVPELHRSGTGSAVTVTSPRRKPAHSLCWAATCGTDGQLPAEAPM